jgi:hypothetical protein
VPVASVGMALAKVLSQRLEGYMEDNQPHTYWSVCRANVQREDGPRSIKTAAALEEIGHAIRSAFPVASEVTVRADLCDVLVKFVTGQKSVSVRFSSETLEVYRRGEHASRQQALKTLRLVCDFACAREYVPDDDPVNPFVIDAKMALSNTLT